MTAVNERLRLARVAGMHRMTHFVNDRKPVSYTHLNLNADHTYTILAEAKKCAEKVITFGLMPEADVFGYDIITDSDGIAFKARTPKFDEEFKIGIRGLFNVQNALAAIAMCTALDVPVSYTHLEMPVTEIVNESKRMMRTNKMKY